MDLAAAKGLPLYSDDAVLRGLARSIGVPASGTAALLHLLQDTGRLPAEQHRQWRQELRRQLCVDLPFDPAEVAELAEEQGWRPGAAALVLARPATWRDDPWAALRLLPYAQAQMAHDPQAATDWVYAGILGFAADRHPALIKQLAQDMVFDCMRIIDGKPEHFSILLLAATSACERLGVHELLEGVVSDLFGRLSAKHPPELAVRLIVHMTSGLPETHRRRVLGSLLSTG